MSKSYQRGYTAAEFKAIKTCPRETTLEEYMLIAAYEWNERYKKHMPGHIILNLHHLVTRSHVSCVRNGKVSPWNDDYTFREVLPPPPMPISPDTLPAPDQVTPMPSTVRGPKREMIARQILGLFWEGKPVQIHNIIRKMRSVQIEEEVTRNVVSALRIGGVLANPEKGIYARADPNAPAVEPADA